MGSLFEFGMGASGDKKTVDPNGKAAMERVGLFSEVGYISIGDRYKNSHPDSKPFHQTAYKGKQMMTSGNIKQTALQTGYFEPKFNRILEGEAYIEPTQVKRSRRLERSRKMIGRKIWFPSDGQKEPSGLGSHYGTLSGKISHFSAETKPKPTKAPELKNMITNPPKKGSGYGYCDVTLEKYHPHANEPYNRSRQLINEANAAHHRKVKGKAFKLNNHPADYFDGNPFKRVNIKGKQPEDTGRKDQRKIKPFQTISPSNRCFQNYPKHSYDPYIPPKKTEKKIKTKGLFMPTSGPKSCPTPSVTQQNINKAVNKLNYKTIIGCVSKF